jgi:hypothetical protein
MKTFAATTTIHARPDTIWAILTDAAAYPGWSSTIERIDGRIAAGEKVTVHTKDAPGRAFPLTVTEFVPPQRMVWRGGMPLGLFTGTRSYVLTPTHDGAVEFAMHEEFRGPLAPLFGRAIPDLQPAFDRFAADLKRRAEEG